jgi:hypothetical protein
MERVYHGADAVGLTRAYPHILAAEVFAFAAFSAAEAGAYPLDWGRLDPRI